jgi:hypothetical protein
VRTYASAPLSAGASRPGRLRTPPDDEHVGTRWGASSAWLHAMVDRQRLRPRPARRDVRSGSGVALCRVFSRLVRESLCSPPATPCPRPRGRQARTS